MTTTIYQPSAETQSLIDEMSQHAFWSNKLLTACRAGKLTVDDFKYLWSQYYAYSRNFTRYLAGVMATCADDYLRSRLSENIWEEGGGAAPEERHAEIFRRFLVDTMGIAEPRALTFEAYTERFVTEYLASTASTDHVYAAAYLSLGTEAIVSRMYGVFVEGMRAAGIAEADMRFFHIHIGCDDEHAATLMMILEARRHELGWIDRVRRGMNDALVSRARFFNDVYDALEERRVQPLVDRVRARQELAPEAATPADYLTPRSDRLDRVYANLNERLNIMFTVERVRAPGGQVLDPRLVRIPAGWNNERHRHAHETLFVIMSGVAEVLIGDQTITARAGEMVFIPRWVFHQSRNIGDGELVILAVTDFGFTSAVLGDYDKTTRLKLQGADAQPAAAAAVSAPEDAMPAPLAPAA